jgi:hypothetical protein
LAASVVLAFLWTSEVAAHSEQGLLTLDATASRQPLAAEVRARLVYVSDGHPASNASVTVEALGPNGLTVPARAMTSEGDGVYTSSVVLPTSGPWTFRAVASDPSATAETGFDAAPPPSAGSTGPAARALTAAMSELVPTMSNAVAFTAADDPDQLLGRPGQYASKANFADARIGDAPGVPARVDDGGSVETFASGEDAKERRRHVKATIRSGSGSTEYLCVYGTTLLRLSSDLTPSQARGYDAATRKILKEFTKHTYKACPATAPQ